VTRRSSLMLSTHPQTVLPWTAILATPPPSDSQLGFQGTLKRPSSAGAILERKIGRKIAQGSGKGFPDPFFLRSIEGLLNKCAPSTKWRPPRAPHQKGRTSEGDKDKGLGIDKPLVCGYPCKRLASSLRHSGPFKE
jgi:hypothetical protein